MGEEIYCDTARLFNVSMEADYRFITLYLLAFYVIFECVLNVFAEVTRFADRGFYDAWWNSTTWDQVRHPKATTSIAPSLIIPFHPLPLPLPPSLLSGSNVSVN